MKVEETRVTDELIKYQDKADKLISITIPDLQHKLATLYDSWTPDNRSKALQLDASITAGQVELDKLHLYNDY